MGFGDFVKGALHDAGSIAGDVGGAVKNVAKAGEEAVKGGAWLANPTHWDDVAKAGYHAEQFVQHHPGETFDIAKNVGIHMLKDQLKPSNLLLTGGLLAATVLTGGAAGGALAAEVADTAVTGIKAG